MDQMPEFIGKPCVTSYQSLNLLDHIPVGECVLHADGTVGFWNVCLENWTAIPKSQIVGQPIERFFPHLSQAKYTRRLQETFERGFTVIFSSQLHPHLIPCAYHEGLRVQHTIVTAIPSSRGVGFDALLSIQDVTDLTQQIKGYKTIQSKAWTEVKQRQAVEEQLRYDRDLMNAILHSSAAAITVIDTQGNLIFANQRSEQILGLVQSQAIGNAYRHPQWRITDFEGNPLPPEQLPFMQVVRANKPIFEMQCRIQYAERDQRFLTINGSPLRDGTGKITAVVLSISDITLQKQAADELNLRYQQERLVDRMVQHIRQSLNLREILQTAVIEIQQLLQVDRVLIYQLVSTSGEGRVMAEACNPPYPSLLEWTAQNVSLEELNGCYLLPAINDPPHIQAVADISQALLKPDYVQFLQQCSVQARLAIPILIEDTRPPIRSSRVPSKLWGWLIAHQCCTPRTWQLQEIDLLQRLESQLAVAIHQSELHQQVQHLNINLERQVHARTLELQQALTLEATLKRITDKVRDSLDENQILQTVVEELAQTLEVRYCHTTLYNTQSKTAVLQHHYPNNGLSVQPDPSRLEQCSKIYDQIFRGQYFAFCWFPSSTDERNAAMLVCPIVEDQGVLGDLWLFKPEASSFSHLEIRLVQQVANQCAIAIRQAQLYHTAQQQVEELARLNRLKDDFLSTISHELRTPIASIRMALQTLEILFERPEKLQEGFNQADQYFHLLEDECQREAKLIDDLLDLTRLDAGTEPLVLASVNLNDWLPHIAEVFEDRIHDHQQTLCFDLPPDLPLLVTDLTILERILVELLNNACKYTPAGETITIAAQAIDPEATLPSSGKSRFPPYQALVLAPDQVVPGHGSPFACPLPQQGQQFQIRITNTGVEIAPQELSHIFDKFYRIPSQDPWKCGGTGLGLALAKRMAEYLGGIIQVESANNKTCFMLELLAVNC